MADKVSGRLRKYQLKATGVKVDIKDPNFIVISRQKKLALSTNFSTEIAHCALDIIRTSWKEHTPIRLITITGINLVDEKQDEQLSLFASSNKNRKQDEDLSKAIDIIRQKYGSASLMNGSIIDNDIGLHLVEYSDD